jgi:hypothetical protein
MTGREKIFIFAAGLFIGLTALYLLAGKPIYSKFIDDRNKIEQKKLLLSRYKNILKRGDKLKERETYIKKEFEKLDGILLTGAKPSLAASELQSIMENIVSKVNVTIKSVRNKKPQKKNSFYLIPIEITVESTLRELRDVIYHIEKSNKFLFVKDLYIKLVKSGNPEKLENKLVVEGFIKNNSNL